MPDLTVCFSLLVAGGFAGALVPLWLDLKSSRALLEAKVKEFDEVTRKASEANNSLATKILQFEEKLHTLDFRTQAVMQPPSSAWKAKQPIG